MSLICPTVMPTSDDPHVFRTMMERVALLSHRVQIDVMDGRFAPHRNIAPSRLWWPEQTRADIHVLYEQPESILETLIALRPHCIIIHAEARADIAASLLRIRRSGCWAGLALLPQTSVNDVASLIRQADHVLIFGGTLGEAGHADLEQLTKVEPIRAIAPKVEIGWDGGANGDTVKAIATAGVDVINVGSALQRAENPRDAYDSLLALVSTNE